MTQPGCEVSATFDAKGDLVDLDGAPDDLLADELNAWTEDVRSFVYGIA